MTRTVGPPARGASDSTSGDDSVRPSAGAEDRSLLIHCPELMAVGGVVIGATPGPVAKAPTAALSWRPPMLLPVVDIFALAAAAGVGGVVLEAVNPVRAGDITVYTVIVTVLSLAAALRLHGIYGRPASRLRPSAWWKPSVIARCLPTAALLALGSEALLLGHNRLTLTASVVMTLPAVALIPLGREIFLRLFGPPAVTRLLLVGSGQVADRLLARLDRCADTTVVGQVDGHSLDLPDLCRAHQVDRVIVAFSDTPDSLTLEGLRGLDGQVPISVVPRLFELHSWRSEVEELYGLPLLHIPPASLAVSALMAKRALDVTVAFVAIILTAPVWALVAVAIKLESPGSVFFLQERCGRGERRFKILKFRTMRVGAADVLDSLLDSSDSDGPLFKLRKDPRVTRIGRLLRRTSIDELPQLLNVLRGQMSLVGPRPFTVEESARLDGPALVRFDARPGLTGLWQVSGRSDLTYADLQHLDSVYVRSWSLLWDLRIIRDTPASVLAGKGAY